MAIDLDLYLSDDTTAVTSISFSSVVPGTPSAGVTYHLWNHKGAGSGDTAQNILASIALRLVATGGSYLGSGIDVLDQNAVQIRITGGNGISPTTTGWQDLGAGSYVEFPDLPYNSAVHFEVRVNPSSGIDISAVEGILVISSSLSRSIGDGHSLMSADGVVMRLGNTIESGIVRCGTVVEDGGGASFDVDIAEWMWIADGELWSIYSDTITVGGTDVNAATPAGGEQFIALLSGAADGTITVTKGAKATAGSEVAPDLPAGEPLIATCVVDATSILDADITTVTEHDFLGMADDFSTIGPGTAVVDGRIIRRTSSEAPTGLGASNTYTIWMTRLGNLSTALSSAGAPEDGAIALWEVDTDGGSAITAARDLRRLIGPFVEHELQFTINGSGGSGILVAATDTSQVIGKPGQRRRAWLHPLDTGMCLFTDAVGGTSGETSVNLQSNPSGAGWSSLFGSAVLAQLPQVIYTSTTLFAFGHFAESLEIAEGDQLRALVNSVPGSAVPTRATLSVTVLVI